ncbi:cobalamin-dependent protein [Streptomyces flaveolus]
MVAEVLRLRGWRVDYLGAHTPTRHLVSHLHNTGSEAVLLSATLPTRLPAAHAAVTACRAMGVPVMAGGRAVGPDGRHAHALGADAWAPDARAAAAVLDEGLPAPDPGGGPAGRGRSAPSDRPGVHVRHPVPRPSRQADPDRPGGPVPAPARLR